MGAGQSGRWGRCAPAVSVESDRDWLRRPRGAAQAEAPRSFRDVFTRSQGAEKRSRMTWTPRP